VISWLSIGRYIPAVLAAKPIERNGAFIPGELELGTRKPDGKVIHIHGEKVH
jgi:hypothetical protein